MKLNKSDLDKIQSEVEAIGNEIAWLDPSIPGEDTKLANHLARLEELEKILLTSLKNHRIEKIGLKVIQ